MFCKGIGKEFLYKLFSDNVSFPKSSEYEFLIEYDESLIRKSRMKGMPDTSDSSKASLTSSLSNLSKRSSNSSMRSSSENDVRIPDAVILHPRQMISEILVDMKPLIIVEIKSETCFSGFKHALNQVISFSCGLIVQHNYRTPLGFLVLTPIYFYVGTNDLLCKRVEYRKYKVFFCNYFSPKNFLSFLWELERVEDLVGLS